MNLSSKDGLVSSQSFMFWPWCLGLQFLIIGVVLAQMRVAGAPWLDRAIALGPPLFAAALAVMATRNFLAAQFVNDILPDYLPGRQFWAYFIGIALLCAVTSIITMRYISVASALLGAMLFFLVILFDIHLVAAIPSFRPAWALALRNIALGGAAWVLAGCRSPKWRESAGLIAVGRFTVAIPVIFFAVTNFVYPHSAPFVTLHKRMPSFVPFSVLWGYFSGAILLAVGISILLKKHTQSLSAAAGLFATSVALFVYCPMIAQASEPIDMREAINCVIDALAFAGILLIVADASPADHDASALRLSVGDA